MSLPSVICARIRAFTVVVATCVLATAASVSLAAVDPEVQKHFDQGNSLYQDGRYADALVEYDAAYALSRNWKILFNRGQCLVMLKRDPEAIVVFQQYLDEGGAQIAPERKKQIEEDLPKLRARVATIQVENAPVGSIVYLDDRRLGPVLKPSSGPTEMAIPIGAGEHELKVEPPPGFNAPPFKRTVKVTGGTLATVRVEFDVGEATAPATPVQPDYPVPPPPAVLPPHAPGGLPAPSLQFSAQGGVVVPSLDYFGVERHALGSLELAASYRLSGFFEFGVFGDFATGKPTLTDSARSSVGSTKTLTGLVDVDPNATYSYRILGVRGRLHLLRTKNVDGWFGVDVGAWQETWKFTGNDAFEFTASSPALGLGAGFDVPIGKSWAVGAAGRILTASANEGSRRNCAKPSECASGLYLPGEGPTGNPQASSRGFFELGAHLIWVLPIGEPPAVEQPKTASGAKYMPRSLSPAGKFW